MKFFDPVILTAEYNGISKGSRGYFIESVSDRVCTVLFNEWYCHDEVEVPIKYLKLRNHYDYEMKEYIRYHDITLLVNDYGEIKFTKIVDGYGWIKKISISYDIIMAMLIFFLLV